MKRHLVFAALIASVAMAAPCLADNFFKDALKSAAQGALGGGQQGAFGQAAGQTNLPAGQYMMTNMYSGQAFYVTVTPQGQIFAADPRSVQVILQPAGGGMINQGLPQQGGGGGIGGLLNRFGGQGGGGGYEQ